MEMAIVGLGKMGGNMARRLSKSGHHIVAFNRSRETTDQIAAEVGLTAAYSLEEVAQKLSAPRHVWLMLPAGATTTEHVEKFMALLSAGDTIIDGGNSNYKEDAKHAAMLKTRGIHFVDLESRLFTLLRIAGIMGAKKTADLVPLCHPLSLSRSGPCRRQPAPTARPAGSAPRGRRDSRHGCRSSWSTRPYGREAPAPF